MARRRSTSATTAATSTATRTSTRSCRGARGGCRSASTSTPTSAATSTARTARSTARRRAGPRASTSSALRVELDDLLARAAGDLWAEPPFDTVAPELRRVADVAFAGDGEPTTPPEFPAAAAAARESRDRLAPGVPLRLLTNATLFHKDRVRAALADFDELWCKLDAGTEPYFQLVDGTRLPLQRVLDNLLPRRPRAADRRAEPVPRDGRRAGRATRRSRRGPVAPARRRRAGRARSTTCRSTPSRARRPTRGCRRCRPSGSRRSRRRRALRVSTRASTPERFASSSGTSPSAPRARGRGPSSPPRRRASSPGRGRAGPCRARRACGSSGGGRSAGTARRSRCASSRSCPARVPAGRSRGGHRLREALRRRRQVVEHPVDPGHLRRLRVGRVRVVHDQHEALRPVRHPRPLERGREVAPLAREQLGDLPARDERGRAQRQCHVPPPFSTARVRLELAHCTRQ